MSKFTRLDEVYAQIRNYQSDYDVKTKRTNQLLENIAITNAIIYDKLEEISHMLKAGGNNG